MKDEKGTIKCSELLTMFSPQVDGTEFACGYFTERLDKFYLEEFFKIVFYENDVAEDWEGNESFWWWYNRGESVRHGIGLHSPNEGIKKILEPIDLYLKENNITWIVNDCIRYKPDIDDDSYQEPWENYFDDCQ